MTERWPHPFQCRSRMPDDSPEQGTTTSRNAGHQTMHSLRESRRALRRFVNIDGAFASLAILLDA